MTIYIYIKYLTFFRPTKKGSDFDSADAVGGVGGILLQTPKVAMTTPRKAGTENIYSYKGELIFKN